MLLSASEILDLLGFQIPPEGVCMNPHDRLLHTEALKALGATMRVSAIPEHALEALHARLVESVAQARGEPAQPSAPDLMVLRTYLQTWLQVVFGKTEQSGDGLGCTR